MRKEIVPMVAMGLLFAVLAFLSSAGSQKWSGSDDKAVSAISELTGGSYHPWIRPVWEPQNNGIESLLFSLQAASGGVVIGYFLGHCRT